MYNIGVSIKARHTEIIQLPMMGSMPTIYNYRSRIKSRSIYDKDEFDRRLMQL